MSGVDRVQARAMVESAVEQVLDAWLNRPGNGDCSVL